MRKLHSRLLAASLLSATARSAIIVSVPPPGITQQIEVPNPKDGEKSPAAEQGDVLQFLNRDSLHGSLLAIDPQTGVRWRSPEAREAIEFNTARLAEIRLAPHKVNAPPEKDAFRIVMTNNDELEGSVISLDGETLELDTWYAGRLSIPRAMIKNMTPRRQNSATIYEGPTSLEGWSNTEQENGWKYRDGTFYTHNNGILGRDFKLPDLSDIEFDMAWGGFLQIGISVYTDQVDNFGGNAYVLQINNNYVYVQRMRRNSGSNNIGNTQLQSLMQKSKAHFSIRVNKDAKTIALFVDGHLAKQWTDRGEFAGGGGGIAFYSQGRGLIKLSNIKIDSWDGKLEEPPKPGDKSPEDTLRLANGDKVSGSLKEIAKGNAALASMYAPLNIPIDRIEEIDMAGKNADQAKRKAGDVRVYFAGGGMVTVSVEKWDGKELIGTSPNFGRATFKTEAFERIQFNLDSESRSDDDMDGGDDSQNDGEQGFLNNGLWNGRGVIRVIHGERGINVINGAAGQPSD